MGKQTNLNSLFANGKGRLWPLLAVAMAVILAGCHSAPVLISERSTHAAYRPVFFSTPECIAYDKTLIATITRGWDDLLNGPTIPKQPDGKVVVSFELHSDGSINGFRIIKSTVDDMFTQLCVTAISSHTPFSQWPDSMPGLVKANRRQITLTFSYPEPKVTAN